jgi:FkbM family methyltransferase
MDSEVRHALWHGASPAYEHIDLLQALPAQKTVLDVGANVGQFAMVALKAFPQAHVYSFEPIEDIAHKFKRVMAKEKRVTLFHTALGNDQGKAKIHVTARSDSSSLLVPALQEQIFPGTHEAGQQEIKIARLQDVLAIEKIVAPALLKIDVQGFEGEVLKGCHSLLNRFDWIYCELSFVELYSGQPLAHEIIILLHEAGFVLDGVYMDVMSYKDGRAIQGDFLFRRARLEKI